MSGGGHGWLRCVCCHLPAPKQFVTCCAAALQINAGIVKGLVEACGRACPGVSGQTRRRQDHQLTDRWIDSRGACSTSTSPHEPSSSTAGSNVMMAADPAPQCPTLLAGGQTERHARHSSCLLSLSLAAHALASWAQAQILVDSFFQGMCWAGVSVLRRGVRRDFETFGLLLVLLVPAGCAEHHLQPRQLHRAHCC